MYVYLSEIVSAITLCYDTVYFDTNTYRIYFQFDKEVNVKLSHPVFVNINRNDHIFALEIDLKENPSIVKLPKKPFSIPMNT